MARVEHVLAEDVVINALKRLGCPVETVVPVQELQGDLGIDSTEMVELAALVRSECGMALQPVDLRSIQTVADLTSKINLFLATQH
jgi:acyl carrier protein